MLRLSKLTDYAVVVLVRLSREQRGADVPGHRRDHRHPGAHRGQGAEDAWPPAGWSRRSAAREAATGCCGRWPAIPVADVIAAVDGPIALTACVEALGRGV